MKKLPAKDSIMKKNIFISILIVTMLVAAPALRAQILSGGTNLAPGAPPAMVGIELGLGQHQQLGTLEASCRCEFNGGTGTGFLGGLLFELPLDYEWTLGLGARFDFKSTSSTTNVVDTATITFSNNSNVSSGTFTFQRDGKVKETFLTLAPFLRYELARNGPFVQVGPGIGFLLSSHFTHTRVLNSGTITLTDGTQLSGVRFQNGTRTETLQDSVITNASGTRISALATFGWNIAIGDNAVIAPMITYDFPFTLVRPDTQVEGNGSQGWKLATLFFSVGLKYKLD